jgi:hypothetical protein
MLFLDQDDKVSKETVEKGKALSAFFTELNTAMEETFIKTKDTLGPFDKLIEKLTQTENVAVGIQRSMGGAFAQMGSDAGTFGEKFRNSFYERLKETTKESIKFGGSFTDVANSVGDLAESMGRVVNPSQETLLNMVALTKTTGQGSKEIASMVESLSSLGGNQKQATESISKMAQEARKVGLDATKFVKQMATDLDKVSGFGFKNKPIESLTRMTKQAQMLKTTFSSIVGNLQDTVLDPEGAIETAAKFQMLGGEVGKLADPFQLMYMAQTDMEGLQKELVKSTQAAFKFNAETGNFDASTQDLYRLREQAQITGTKLEDLVKTGREAAKLDYIKDKFDFTGVADQDTKDLLAGLAEVGKDGKVTIDIPGFGIIKEGQALSADATKALEEYQKVAAMDEKEIAQRQLTTTEKQQIAVEQIKNAVLLNLTEDNRQKVLEQLKSTTEAYQDAASDASGAAGTVIGNNAAGVVTETGVFAEKAIGATTGYGDYGSPAQRAEFIGAIQALGDLTNVLKFNTEPSQDLFVPSSGQGPKVMAEGKIFKGIVGDEVAMGTNLTEAFSRVSTLKDLISNQTKNTSEKQNLDGNLKIDINVGGKVDGDKNNDMSKLFSNPVFQKQVMDMVLYKMKDYQKQQGVL